MVGRFIAWLLRRAGYELVPSAEVSARLRRLEGKLSELDGVVCTNIDDIEELRAARPQAVPDENKPNDEMARTFAEYLYGFQPMRGENE